MSKLLREVGGVFGVVFALVAGCTEPTSRPETKAASEAKDAPETAPRAPLDGMPEAEQLLADVVDAMGGADKFAAVKSYYSESNLDMGTLGLTGVAKLWWREGDFYIETEMPGIGLQKLGGKGDRLWGDNPVHGLRALAGKEAEQARSSSALCLAYEWKKHFTSAKTVAMKPDANGVQIAEIEFTSPLGDKVVLRVNLETKLPLSQSLTQANPFGDIPETVTFSDYRDVEGLKLPFKQTVEAPLMKATATMTKIELNVATDTVPFDMPGASTAVSPGQLVDALKPVEAKADAKKGEATAKPPIAAKKQ